MNGLGLIPRSLPLGMETGAGGTMGAGPIGLGGGGDPPGSPPCLPDRPPGGGGAGGPGDGVRDPVGVWGGVVALPFPLSREVNHDDSLPSTG